MGTLLTVDYNGIRWWKYIFTIKSLVTIPKSLVKKPDFLIRKNALMDPRGTLLKKSLRNAQKIVFNLFLFCFQIVFQYYLKVFLCFQRLLAVILVNRGTGDFFRFIKFLLLSSFSSAIWHSSCHWYYPSHASMCGWFDEARSRNYWKCFGFLVAAGRWLWLIHCQGWRHLIFI